VGSEARYYARKKKWEQEVSLLSQLRHHGWWLLHNAVSHPWLGVAPSLSAIWFHDYTSMRLNRRRQIKQSPEPLVLASPIEAHRREWLIHNVLGHLAIGFFPCRASFKYHDRGAEAMQEPEWL
jgi:hypothetical protein